MRKNWRRSTKIVLVVLLLLSAAGVLLNGVIDLHSRFGTKLVAAAAPTAAPAAPLTPGQPCAECQSSDAKTSVLDSSDEACDASGRERPIAEPATVLLVGLGLTLFSLLRRRPETA